MEINTQICSAFCCEHIVLKDVEYLQDVIKS